MNAREFLGFKRMVREVSKTEVVVLSDVHSFPSQGDEFISPNLVICIGNKGHCYLRYDMQQKELVENRVAVVMPNHIVMPLSQTDDYTITLIVISPALFEEIKLRSLSHDHFKYHLEPETNLSPEQSAMIMKVVDVLKEVAASSQRTMPNRHEMVVYLIDIFFELLNSYRPDSEKDNVNMPNNRKLFNDFCDLLALHYRESREVSFYAEKLNYTPKYFSKVISDTIGVSANHWIEEYVTMRAKQLLTTRYDLSVQQVAYHLGFNEPSAFCRFFKRIALVTPRAYRMSAKDAR